MKKLFAILVLALATTFTFAYDYPAKFISLLSQYESTETELVIITQSKTIHEGIVAAVLDDYILFKQRATINNSVEGLVVIPVTSIEEIYLL